jgi:hypothetical protein
VPIVDVGIPALKGYPPYEEGIARGVFVLDVEGEPYSGEVCTGTCGEK